MDSKLSETVDKLKSEKRIIARKFLNLAITLRTQLKGWKGVWKEICIL